MKKSILVLVSLILMFSNIYGAKKNNINKYIFAGGNWLVVFDGESKSVQSRQFGTNIIQNIYYFIKQKKIILNANSQLSLYSVNADNLNNYKNINLQQFNKQGKRKNFVAFVRKKNNNNILFQFIEWEQWWIDRFFVGIDAIPKKYKQGYLWNINNNTFTKFNLPKDPWEMEDDDSLQLMDDPYQAENFQFYKLTDKMIGLFKESYESRKNAIDKERKRLGKKNRRMWKVTKRFKKLLEKGKIDVGSYSQISDLETMPTGGRYMVVRNDKLYLVHMKTKKVYTLMDNPFRELRYFIIEKNEDDVDLDAE